MYSEIFLKEFVKNLGLMSGLLLSGYLGWTVFKTEYRKTMQNKETYTEDTRNYKTLLDKVVK